MIDLLDQRSRIKGELSAILEKPDGKDGDLSKDQDARFQELKGEAEQLEKRIERQALVDEIDRRIQGELITGTGDDRLDLALRDFSLVRAIAGQVPDLNVDDGRERELSKELQKRSGRKHQGLTVPYAVFRKPVNSLEQRVITTAAPVGGPGSNIVPTEHMAGAYIDLLRSALVVRAMGATVLSGLMGNVDIPKAGASGTSAWVAENGALSVADLEFVKVQLTPKHAGALTEFSRNMLMQTSPDIEELVRRDFAALMAQAIDSAALRGGGANEPTGIIATSTVPTVSMSGGPTWAKVLEVIATVEVADGDVGALGWVANPWCKKSMMATTKESSDAAGGYVQDDPMNLAGYPFRTTTNLQGYGTDSPPTPAGQMIFGAWSQLLLGIWSEFDLLVNPYESTAYTKGNVQVRGMATVDVAVRHAESFCTVEDMDFS